MLGSLPPLRGLSSYCLELASSVSNLAEVEFISFKKLYPAFLYPGGGLEDDHTFPVRHSGRLKIKRRLTWYNPFTWLADGFFTKADMLHAQWWSLPLFPVYAIVAACFKIRRLPVIITVHNVLPHEKTFFFRKVSGLLFMLGDHFIVHNEQGRSQMTLHYGILENKISVIPHGPLDLFLDSDADPEQIRREMGIDPGHKIILLFGAIRHYKGIDTALIAFSKVKKIIPEARLLIAGKLWEKWEPYEELMKKLGIGDSVTVFTDYVPTGDVCRYFRAADLVILPYRHFDSQSGVAGTAVSFRKPMIVTDVGGLPEMAGDRRAVVSPDDPDDLARAIAECLNDQGRLEEMSKNSEVIYEKIAWPSIARKTLAVYKMILCISEPSDKELKK